MYGNPKLQPLYSRWKAIKHRCDSTSNPRYKDYGGRGITLCESWRDFTVFARDVGLPPTSKHQLDRKDNDGNYEPNNVRWVTPQENANNQRTYKTNTSGLAGVSWHRQKQYWVVYSKPLYGEQQYLGKSADFFEAACLRKSWEARNKKVA